jgi:amino acid permease
MENLILIIFLILVICFMFLIIINKQQPRQTDRTDQVEQSYLGIPILLPFYRWWWPYYYGSGSSSSTYYSTYRYPRHRHHRRHKRKHSKKNSITIIADKTGKTHVASRKSVIPVTVSGKRDNIRLASMRSKSILVKIPNKSVSNNKMLLKKLQ